MSDVQVKHDVMIAHVEMRRPPDNYFDRALIGDLADAFEAFDRDPAVRCIVLCAEGRNFCAGADFRADADAHIDPEPVYSEALRLFRIETPVVAAIQGSAIGGGLGLALVADFRVATASSRFAANFNRLGIHPGFALSDTLPRLVGAQRAALLFYTGRRLTGAEALSIGLIDQLAEETGLRDAAIALANEICTSAPLAVSATRRTMRQGLADAAAAAVAHELSEQRVQFATSDFREGVCAMASRRTPQLDGR